MTRAGPAPHFAQLILDELLADPRASALLEFAQNASDLLSTFRSAHQPAFREEPPLPKAPTATARQLLLFGEDDVLSRAAIRTRRAALAALCHPDRGGNVRIMASLNAAADQLLSECEGER